MSRYTAILCSLFFHGAAFAYTPPIGIPDPGMWGGTHPIDGVAPSAAIKCPNWPTAQSEGCYYVDGTSGSDVGTGNGTPNAPRKTIPNTISAGGYVELHGNFAAAESVSASGTSTDPIWIVGVDGDIPSFRSTLTIDDSAYLFVDNVDFFMGQLKFNVGFAADTIHHIAIRNGDYSEANNSLIAISGDEGDKINDIVVYNNTIHDTGDWTNTLTDNDYHGVAVDLWSGDATSNLHNVWIIGNTFYHLDGDSVQVNAGNWNDSLDYLHHVYYGFNISYENRQSGFYSKQASDVIVSQNTISSMWQHGSQQGVGVGGLYSANRYWIIFNDISDCNNGVRQGDTTSYRSIDTTEMEWVKNGSTNEYYTQLVGGGSPLLYDISSAYKNGVPLTNAGDNKQGLLAAGQYSHDTVNYTLYVRLSDDTQPTNKAISCRGIVEPDSKMYVIGNKFHNIHKHPGDTDAAGDYYGTAVKFAVAGIQRWMVDNTAVDVRVGAILKGSLSGITLTGNLISGIADDAGNGSYYYLYIPSPIDSNKLNIDYSHFYDQEGSWRAYFLGTSYTTELAFNTATSAYSIHDTHLGDGDPLITGYVPQPPSPVIDEGVESPVYSIFQTLYGLSIKKDIAGNARPLGSAWDIGAYEYTDGAIRARGFRVRAE